MTTDVLADLPATHQALLSAPLCERRHRVPKVRFCPKSKLVRDGTGTWLSQVYLYQHLCLQVSTAENQHQCAHFTEQSTSHTYTPSPERPRLALHLELKTNGTTFHLVSSAGGHILQVLPASQRSHSILKPPSAPHLPLQLAGAPAWAEGVPSCLSLSSVWPWASCCTFPHLGEMIHPAPIRLLLGLHRYHSAPTVTVCSR